MNIGRRMIFTFALMLQLSLSMATSVSDWYEDQVDISPYETPWIEGPFETSYKIVTSTVTFQSAENSCADMGARLVWLESAEEQSYFKQLVRDNVGLEDIYIGGMADSQRNWFWVEPNDRAAIAISTTDWATGEPNDHLGTNEDCIEMRDTVDLSWNDIPCTELEYYACEKPTITESVREWVEGPFETCYAISNSAATWDDAEATCVQLGTRMVWLESSDEQLYFKGLVLSTVGLKDVWIGGRADSERRWFWAEPNDHDASPISVTDWGSGEPNNYRNANEACIEMRDAENLSWNDAPCSGREFYACEKSC